MIAVVFIRRRRWRSRQKARLERQDDVSVMRSVEESAQSRRPSSLTDEEELVNMMLPWEEVGDVRTYPRQPYQKPSTDVGTLNADLRRMKIVDIPISQVRVIFHCDSLSCPGYSSWPCCTWFLCFGLIRFDLSVTHERRRITTAGANAAGDRHGAHTIPRSKSNLHSRSVADHRCSCQVDRGSRNRDG